jgi:hypothetical protein
MAIRPAKVKMTKKNKKDSLLKIIINAISLEDKVSDPEE